MKRHPLTRPGLQRGVAMVEFAITLPLLLLLLLAIGEFGRMLYQYNVLLQASRDAGRYAASKAWDRALGRVELNNQINCTTGYLAVYGTPPKTPPLKPEDPCNEPPAPNPEAPKPEDLYPVVPGLTLDNVQVTAPSGTTDHVQVSITYSFQPVIGEALPALFGSSIPLGISLRSTVVMRAL